MSRNKWLPSIDPERVSMARDMVIYQDDAVIVFNKPSGLPVQGGWLGHTGHHLGALRRHAELILAWIHGLGGDAWLVDPT